MWFRFLISAMLLGICLASDSRGAAPANTEDGAFLEFCDWTGQDIALLQDLADRQLDQQTLLGAALAASGNGPQKADRLMAIFSVHVRRFRSEFRQTPIINDALIRQLFSHLQENYLRGEYDPELCDVGQTIAHGRFNCLTATILFRALCREFAIGVEAIWEPSHVRCWIPIGAGQLGYIVETTAKSSNMAVSSQVPRHHLTARALTREQLLGKVFYNRGVQLLHRGAFPQALSCTWAGCLLDHRDHPAQNNLRACLNNWALSVSQQRGDFAFAIRLLDAGLQLDPDYEPFSRNLQLLQGHEPMTFLPNHLPKN